MEPRSDSFTPFPACLSFQSHIYFTTLPEAWNTKLVYLKSVHCFQLEALAFSSSSSQVLLHIPRKIVDWHFYWVYTTRLSHLRGFFQACAYAWIYGVPFFILARSDRHPTIQYLTYASQRCLVYMKVKSYFREINQILYCLLCSKLTSAFTYPCKVKKKKF